MMYNAEITHALDVLEKEGRKGFVPDAKVSRGMAIGYALFVGCDNSDIMHAAIEALEQHNNHLVVAALRAMCDGKYKHKGRTLTITLGEEWEPK
jgi:hypothetical protein